ncbi:MAG: hypothetical protein WBY44_22120 [Bryobacteraceae bacterium]
MRLMDMFDIPAEIMDRPHSAAFAEFLGTWFGYTKALSLGEADLSFLNDLTQEEWRLARELIRRNLKSRVWTVIAGAYILNDSEAIPILRRMLKEERSLDLRLTIASALWKLAKDPVLIACLDEARRSGGGPLFAHLRKVLWLNNEWALDFMIDLLSNGDSLASSGALYLLNELEFGERILKPLLEMPRQARDFEKRRNDPDFRRLMTDAIRRWNETTTILW